jgi:hypothetical protein
MSDEVVNVLRRIEDAFSAFAREQQRSNERLVGLLANIRIDMTDVAVELKALSASVSGATTFLQSLDEHFTQRDDDEWPTRQ